MWSDVLAKGPIVVRMCGQDECHGDVAAKHISRCVAKACDFFSVGVPGFEPGTSSLSVTRSNHLSYTPDVFGQLPHTVAHKTTHAVVGWAFTFLHRRPRRFQLANYNAESTSTHFTAHSQTVNECDAMIATPNTVDVRQHG